MILRLTRFLSGPAATLTCISGWTWMSGIRCASTASSALIPGVIVTSFTREQIQQMLRRTENDAADQWRQIMNQMDHYAKLQRNIGAMKMELEIMEEKEKT